MDATVLFEAESFTTYVDHSDERSQVFGQDVKHFNSKKLLSNAAKVEVYYANLRCVSIGKETQLTVDTKEAGSGNLAAYVEGPGEITMNVVDNGDCTYKISLNLSETGKYRLNVLFEDDYVPGSPYTFYVRGKPGKHRQIIESMIIEKNKRSCFCWLF